MTGLKDDRDLKNLFAYGYVDVQPKKNGLYLRKQGGDMKYVGMPSEENEAHVRKILAEYLASKTTQPATQPTQTITQKDETTPPPSTTQQATQGDRTLVEAALALPRQPNPTQVEGKIAASGATQKLVGDVTWMHNVTTEVGRMFTFEGMKYLDLSEEERKDPDLAVKKFEKWGKELVMMKYHAEILDEAMLENEVAKQAISDLQKLAYISTTAYDTLLTVLCDKCRKRGMWAVALKAVGPQRIPERSEVIPK